MARSGRKSDERPTCGACGGVAPAGAAFCPSCGNRLAAPDAAVAAPPPPADFAGEFDARESQALSREMYERHLGLLRDYRARIRDLGRRAAARGGALDELEAAPLSPETTRRVQEELLEIEDLGDRWEGLQHDYNHDSEAVDEEFLDRFSELEVDVDLPENLQLEINTELEAMNADLEGLGRELRVLGTRGEALLGRASGRWGAGARRAAPAVELAVLGVAAAAGAALLVWDPAPWAPWAALAAPCAAWLGLALGAGKTPARGA